MGVLGEVQLLLCRFCVEQVVTNRIAWVLITALLGPVRYKSNSTWDESK